MLVILKQDVKGTGKAGDVMKVSDGYARNMLIPKGLAIMATDKNVRSVEKQKKVLKEKQDKEKEKAVNKAIELKEKSVIIKTKTGDNGKLFGSITTMDIAKALKEQESVDVDKKKILLKTPIKQIGVFEVDIKIYPEVVATVKVEVIAD
ncbi:MAG: 50S ribosomal protein L9 [Peptostreptococcaceae bacterium]|nr:50S ribosomal protein L9 [Peptostreptococcaceae bacterium]